MKFGICNETFKDWAFEDAFAYARELGYQGIEIAPFTIENDVRQISNSKRHEIKQLAEKHELEIIGLHWLLAFTEGFHLTTPDETIQKATTNYLAAISQLCGDLGGKVMVLGSPLQRNLLPGVTNDQAMEIAAEVISRATPSFEENGVILAVEPLGPEEGDFLLTAESGIELIQRVGHPNVRLHLDVKAMSTEVKPIPEIVKTSREHLVHFHANDPNKRGPGMGDVDFAPILDALREIEYEGWVSVEVFDYEPGVENLATQSIACLKSLA
jgi:sugar phosphate isomerase/epimerase